MNWSALCQTQLPPPNTHFHGQQIYKDIGLRGNPTQPTSKLMNHQPRCNAGGVDGAEGSAGSSSGFGLAEKD